MFMKITLIVQSGTLAGKRVDLTEGLLTVGRGAGSNLLFDPMQENMVSTKHAHIEAKPDGFYLIDDRSTNGTFVNGNHIQVVKLNTGDTIQFGKNGPTASVSVEADGFQPQGYNAVSATPAATVQQGNFGEQFQPPPANFGQQSPPNVNQPFQQPQFDQPFQPPPPNFMNSMSSIGIGAAPAVKVEESSKMLKIIGALAALFIYGVLGLVVIYIVVDNLGFVAAVIATVLAFIPPAIYILPLIFLDRYDPEPPWLIAGAFAWGGIVAIVFSYYINTFIGQLAYGFTQNEGLAMIASAVFSAPVFEELTKGLGVVILLIFFRREFDDILDGIVYGGVIGLGFATVENVLYYGRGLYGGADMLVYLLLVRGIMSPFIHTTFTAMTGIGCGISRESHNTFVKLIMPIVGYCGAVALHMAWNGGIATLSQILFGGSGFYIAYAILAVPFFLLFIGFCAYIMRRQNKILREMLAIDVAQGVLSDDQFKTATSAFKSTGWLFGGVFGGKFFPRWKFLRAVGKLGLSYWHIQRANAAQGQTGSFKTNPILRQQVIDLRDKV
jgi:RsiW-degrading membrane proteinase PrsW (M82 family)